MCGKKYSTRYWRKYCEECSEKNKQRINKKSYHKRLKENPARFKKTYKKYHTKKQKMAKETGKNISEKNRFSILDGILPNLKWSITIKYPFRQLLSKNSISRKSEKGYIYSRKDARKEKDALSLFIRNELKKSKIEIKVNKLWVTLLIEKPNNQSDAINFLDNICDAISDAISLDDRWFCVKGIDWRIVKENPYIYIRIGQAEVKDSRVCNYCGRILPFNYFSKNKSEKFGITKQCKECYRLKYKKIKKKNAKKNKE